MKFQTVNKTKMLLFVTAIMLLFLIVSVRMVIISIFYSEKYTRMADEVQERERYVKAARGTIEDRNGVVIATNKTVCTVSVIHSQIKDKDKVTELLSTELDMDREKVEKLVSKRSVREKIKSNVPKETGDRIREQELDGVKVDEDYKRYYPYNEMASKVLGFTGSDNQGIIGLEVKYDKYMKGKNGAMLPADSFER